MKKYIIVIFILIIGYKAQAQISGNIIDQVQIGIIASPYWADDVSIGISLGAYKNFHSWKHGNFKIGIRSVWTHGLIHTNQWYINDDDNPDKVSIKGPVVRAKPLSLAIGHDFIAIKDRVLLSVEYDIAPTWIYENTKLRNEAHNIDRNYTYSEWYFDPLWHFELGYRFQKNNTEDFLNTLSIKSAYRGKFKYYSPAPLIGIQYSRMLGGK